jgi:DNA-binding MltR family transcriptional regulator
MRFRSFLSPESDRGCALIAAAFLDDRLAELLKLYFADEPTVADDVLGQSNPLGTFSSRIDVAYLLGLLSKGEHRALHLIRKIRNAFGHVAEPISFGSPEIASRCKHLEPLSWTKRGHPRAMFTGAVMAVLAGIHFRSRTTKHRAVLKEVDSGWLQKAKGGAGVFRILTALMNYSDAPTADMKKALSSAISEELKKDASGATMEILERLEKVVRGNKRTSKFGTGVHARPMHGSDE